MADQTGPRCGNNPNFRMSDGDQKAVNDFQARLALQAAAKPYIADAVWVDGDPLMEVIAVTLWKHCARDDKDMPLAVCDDPRTIAAFAAAVVRAYAAVQVPATDQAALRDRIAEALYASDHPGHLVPLNETGMEPAYRESADAVLAVLPARVDWTGASVPAAEDELTSERDHLITCINRVRAALNDCKARGATGMQYENAVREALGDRQSRRSPGPLCHETDPNTLRECALRAGHEGDHQDGDLNWPAVGAQQPKQANGDHIVAYRLGGSQSLRCAGCAPSQRGDIWEPITSEDLPDGGVCATCHVDVLIPQELQP